MENDQRLNNALTKLRKLLTEDDKLYTSETEKMHLTILYYTNFDAEEALKYIKQVLTFKLQNEKWFIQLPLARYEKILRRNASAVLNERDNKGRRVYITKLCRIDVNQHQPHEYSCVNDFWLSPCYREPETILNGIILLFDFLQAPLNLLKYCTPSNLKINSYKAQIIPIKNVEFHVLGLNIVVNTMFPLLRPFLGDQIQKNIHIHKNLESLHRHIDKESLPPEYGGRGKFEPQRFQQYMIDNEAILTETALTGYTCP